VPYAHLTENERYVISHLKMAGFSLREIGRRLNRHHTTISREIQRAQATYPHTVYWYDVAQELALRKRSQARHYRRIKACRLVQYVVTRLNKQWSPEAIAGRIRIDHPEDQRMRISPESVYRGTYLEAEAGGEVHLNLRRRHKKRRRQKRYGAGRRFADRKGITQRPKIFESRQRTGDWESDTIEGKKSSGLIATLVERKSCYLLAAK
jgi:IS30 family transposase